MPPPPSSGVAETLGAPKNLVRWSPYIGTSLRRDFLLVGGRYFLNQGGRNCAGYATAPISLYQLCDLSISFAMMQVALPLAVRTVMQPAYTGPFEFSYLNKIAAITGN